MSTHPSTRARFVLIAALLLVCAADLSAQVEVAPTRVLLSIRDRSREIKVINPTDNQVEVDASLGFQLIRTDSLGNMGLDSARTPQELARSCEPWLKVFPRRFVLPPRSARSLRVMITPPDTIGDGEYWGRLIVGSMPVQRGVPVANDNEEGIKTQLTMRIELSIPVIYRKGQVETGVAVDTVQLRRHEGGTLALIDLRRLGNSAYRGTLTAKVENSAGAEVASVSQQLTTEFTLRNGVQLPSLSDGHYRFELNLESTKKGSAEDAVIPAEPVSRTYDLAVSGNSFSLSPEP